jgi:TPR repeat protein
VSANLPRVVFLVILVLAAVECRAADYVKELKAKAEQGDAESQARLGSMYEFGQGLPQDYAEAVKWFRKAAEQGHAGAQNNLGTMYEFGQGLPQDYTEAVKWFRKAANQGEEIAQFNLGGMFYHGQGVPQDYVQAHKWLNLAASKLTGELRNKAEKNREIVAAKMTLAQIAEAQKLAREWKPTAPNP